MTQVMTHVKIDERRDKLKEKGLDAFLEFKAKRYALFRVQNFLNGGVMAEKEHLAVAKDLEKEIEPLGGVKQFAITWDLDPLTDKVIKRDMSVWDAHDEFMKRAAVTIGEAPDNTKSKKKK